MTRYVCCLAVFAVAAVPDWASAFYPRWCPPACAPAPAYPPRFYFAPPCYPVYEVPLPPPVVYQSPVTLAPRPAPPAVRPTEPQVAAPMPAPPPLPTAPEDTGLRPAAGVAPAAPAAPPLPQAKDVLPPLPKANDTLPPLTLPIPEAGPKAATPTPAPAPPDPPALPPVALPKGPEGSLPPLVLPPETGAAPTGVIPPTVAKSSPLAAASRVQVFTTAGAAVGAARKVGFFNHTDRPVALTIEGRAVTLPAKSYLHADLPPTFRWAEAGGEARTTTVPPDAAGVDVLFR